MFKNRSRGTKYFALSAVPLAVALGISGWMTINTSEAPDHNLEQAVTIEELAAYLAEQNEPEEPVDIHQETPEEVRGIYWTAYTAATDRRNQLLDYMLDYGINSVVIDLKMDNGAIAFSPNNEELAAYAQNKPAIKNLDELLAELGEKEIYRIARIPVGRDAVFARANPDVALKTAGGGFWYDAIGSLWLDLAAEEVSDYALALAHEAYDRGFDEVQFDYVRFPSDGYISSIRYPVHDPAEATKITTMQNFFERIWNGVQEKQIPISHDVFGMTFISSYDYNIGQRLVDAHPYTNFISPMVYPSHYANGFRGYANPALHPYDIVKISLDSGAEIVETELEIPKEEATVKFRPWLQDFDIGAVYTSTRIEEQIRATRDAGASGWILWNARNVYEPANYLPDETDEPEETAEL